MDPTAQDEGADAVHAALARLPHGPPFRFVTSLHSLKVGCEGIGVWSVTGDEEFFTGHFPGEPVVPGVLLVEALAQLSGVVCLHGGRGEAASTAARGGRLVHADIRFDHGVTPPADIELRSIKSTSLQTLHRCEVSAKANGKIVARGTLVLADRS